jgi:protein-disulfide isomerase
MNDESPSLAVPVNAQDHIQGLESAPVTLVEYGDYECPHCGAAYPIIKAIQKKLGPKLRFVFRNFPLTSMHPFMRIKNH